MSSSKGSASRKQTTTFNFTDADGSVAYRKIRVDWVENGKKKKSLFFQVKGPRGVWLNQGPETHYLYGLARHIAAPKRELRFVVEGEKKVDALAALGLVAVCSDGGAQSGNWPSDWAELFNSCEVVILPDNDGPGRKYAAAVFEALEPEVTAIAIVNLPGLPEKGDICDWLGDRANTKEVLLQLCAEALRGGDTKIPATPRNQPVTLDPVANAPFPEDPRPEAFHGLAGDLVRLVEPHTEASSIAVMLQTLICFGNVIGSGPHFKVENTKHALNLFGVIVGQTAKGRKGTSWNRVREPFAAVDADWDQKCILSGVASGEVLIWEVRDPVVKVERVSEKFCAPEFASVQVDPGVTDKRLLVLESEFASVLKMADRSGNILSAVLRQAWESGDLRTAAKNTAARATGAHISLVGHITADELRRYLSSTEAANGFGNRLIWCAVRRSKLLPDGGGYIDMKEINARFAAAVSFAREIGQMPRDDEARELWHDVYRQLSRERPGLVGCLLGRAEAQTMRLACIYALLDSCFQVEEVHLKAAVALWDYCERSTAFVFGQSTGDSVADDILAALKKCTDGMSRSDIFSLFSRHTTKERIESALRVLEVTQAATQTIVETGGRPKEIWSYRQAQKAKKAKEGTSFA